MCLEHLIEKPTTSVCGGMSIAKGSFWGSHAYICIQGHRSWSGRSSFGQTTFQQVRVITYKIIGNDRCCTKKPQEETGYLKKFSEKLV